MELENEEHSEELFPKLSPENYVVGSLPKVVDKRGFIYIVQDSKFPEYIKVGRTQDMGKRLSAYNSDKPYDTVTLVAISKMFTNVHEVEKSILNVLKNNDFVPAKQEWFSVDTKSFITKVIGSAETEFECIFDHHST